MDYNEELSELLAKEYLRGLNDEETKDMTMGIGMD